ncbi:hypothetical protein K503DRAFT_772383 [Rhizopogon vinicolor AM-OR11-026]|uniref:Uncharacterized protein n=1 Tax=Rhizopogon vinicolor AM-OR11-026 TaxID=1314800 RepID=A0A1B7MVE1_9AGAM|nr:hypothetical protein K503DRAFT_772383 [Rhizopogon vinicolor AM-OR11-026]
MLATYGAIYNGHFGSLQRFDERTASYKLERICINLRDTAQRRSLITSSATSHIGDKAFEDAIREYQLEEQDNIEASESGVS